MPKQKPLFPVKDFHLKGGKLTKRQAERVVKKVIKQMRDPTRISSIGTKGTDGTY